MYKKYIRHVLVCNQTGILCDSITVKHEYALAQTPLISGGYYSKRIGKRWSELIVEGSISHSDIEHYDSFLEAVSDGPVTLIADITEYYNCVLVETSMTCLPDSSINRFTMKFRSVGNG